MMYKTGRTLERSSGRWPDLTSEGIRAWAVSMEKAKTIIRPGTKRRAKRNSPMSAQSCLVMKLGSNIAPGVGPKTL